MEQKLQELEVNAENEEVLLKSQSKQIKEMQYTLQDMQNAQSKLVRVISNIQENVIGGKDHLDNSNGEEEKPSVSKSTPSQDGPSIMQNAPNLRIYQPNKCRSGGRNEEIKSEIQAS